MFAWFGKKEVKKEGVKQDIAGSVQPKPQVCPSPLDPKAEQEATAVKDTPEKAAQAAADKITKDADADTIILVARKHQNGTLSWSIPPNLEVAAWLHKVLGIAIDEMTKMSFAAAAKQSSILVPNKKIILPGQKN